MTYQITYQGKTIKIELAPKEMSSGGQGRIYKILSPSYLVESEYCVKIYKDEHHSSANKEKIEYMVQNPPQHIDMEKIRICWPEYIVYDSKGRFAGFMMRLAFKNSRDLKILELYTFGKTIALKYPNYPDWHSSHINYELNSPIGFINRVKMLHNLALSIEIIHQSGKYVLVDLKPENVLATADGKISIVDTDSFQIDDGNRQYCGPVATPEYFAKFAKERSKHNLLQTQDCDCFALAVTCYKILIGSHPYSGFKLLPPYNTDDYADIASHIDADLFVFGRRKAYIQQLAINNMHARFAKLPPQLQSLFMEAFTKDKQPTATVWKKALKSIYSRGARIRVPASPQGNSSLNSECACLCVMVIDVSGSMAICINTINNALDKFINDLLKGRNGFKETSKEQVELGIIQFDSECRVLREPALVTHNEKAPTLQVRGLKTNTPKAIRRAIDMVEARKHEYKSVGQSYYRPWIILLTDGNPNPYNDAEVNSIIREVNLGIKNNKFLFTAIGIGTDVDKDFLDKLSLGHFSYINHTNISDFFQTLSASMSLSNGATPQDDLLGELNKSDNIQDFDI